MSKIVRITMIDDAITSVSSRVRIMYITCY